MPTRSRACLPKSGVAWSVPGTRSPKPRRLARNLDQRHGESSRDRMRRIFVNVPVIYGFSSVAPLGPTAATLLGRYLQPSSMAEVGSGRTSPKLLGQFAAESMIAVSGLTETDPHAVYRREVCQFIDDRPSPAEKLGFIHGILHRDMGEVRMFLERIEGLFASLSESERQAPAFSRALGEITRDHVARDRYLRFTEDADRPQIRARMIDLAHALGWLSSADRRAELVRMIGDLLARPSIGVAEVDLFCSLNGDHALDEERYRLSVSPSQADKVTHAAALACLGSAASRARVLQALTSRDDAEVQIAEVYLGHRPINDVNELRAIASGITRMTGSGAQVRALDTLARHRLSDRQSLDELARLFPVAESVDVQRAIAAVFIRSDYQSLPKPEMVRVLSRSRLKSQGGDRHHRHPHPPPADAVAAPRLMGRWPCRTCDGAGHDQSGPHVIGLTPQGSATASCRNLGRRCLGDTSASPILDPDLPVSCSWSSFSLRDAAQRPTPPSARFALSPSIHPTKRRSFASGCRKTTISSSNWWNEAAPIGWRRPAGRAFAVICSSSPAISTAGPSSTRIDWTCANPCRSPRWSAPHAVTPVLACSRN